MAGPAYEIVPAVETLGRIQAMTLMSNNLIPGANMYVEAGWIVGMPDPNPHIDEHVHDYDEIVMHIGTDPGRPGRPGSGDRVRRRRPTIPDQQDLVGLRAQGDQARTAHLEELLQAAHRDDHHDRRRHSERSGSRRAQGQA